MRQNATFLHLLFKQCLNMKIRTFKILFTTILLLLVYSSQGQSGSLPCGYIGSYKMCKGQSMIAEYTPLLMGFWAITLFFLLKNFSQKLPNRNALLICIISILFGLVSYFGSQNNINFFFQIRMNFAWIISLIFCAISFILMVWKMNKIGGYITLVIIVFLSGYFAPPLLKVI